MKGDVSSILSLGLEIIITHLYFHLALCALGLCKLDDCSYKDHSEEKRFKSSLALPVLIWPSPAPVINTAKYS